MRTKPISIIETTVFSRRADKLLSAQEREDVIEFLALNADLGDEIEGTGGVRKIRFAAKGKGKSGGVRVIYYYYDDDVPLYALLIYGKNEQADLTPEQRKGASSFVQAVKDSVKRNRRTER